MAGQRGRPVRPGIRRWQNDETFVPMVTSIMKSRNKSNEETLTDVIYSLEGFAGGALPDGALTKPRREYLHRLARHAKPSLVARILLSWRFDLPDRTIRHIQQRADLKDIAELRWA